MVKDRIKRIVLVGAGVGTSVATLTLAVAAHAQDYSASTTAAITAAGGTVVGMFFSNLPVILGFVVAISITLWGIRWVMSHFRGGKK